MPNADGGRKPVKLRRHIRSSRGLKIKGVFTMTSKELYKDAGSKGAYIDKLREKYPFRICRTSEPQFEAVLKGVQPLNDGDEIPIYRFPGGECCEDPFEVGTTIIEW